MIQAYNSGFIEPMDPYQDVNSEPYSLNVGGIASMSQRQIFVVKSATIFLSSSVGHVLY